MPGRLRSHMEQQGALPVLYASSWLLTAFSSDFPLVFAARVMDVILADCYIEPMMKVWLCPDPPACPACRPGLQSILQIKINLFVCTRLDHSTMMWETYLTCRQPESSSWGLQA